MENMAQKPNSFVHVEIHSNAPEKTKSFLRDVFDWKWQDMPEMNYSMFEAPSAPGGPGSPRPSRFALHPNKGTQPPRPRLGASRASGSPMGLDDSRLRELV